MHFHVVDAYQETGSLLHRTDARVKVIVTLMLILLIALELAPLASAKPDGLECVTEGLSAPGTTGESQPLPTTILPDYTIPILGNSGPSTILVGMVGVLIVFGVAYGVAPINRRVSRRRDLASASPPE